ncbi:LutC/YkgG family protein [Planctellipticum variicoloris]|uniref:LutC/YkgG family protein n=1 Tax=Planctellipticum variicoloris TaxID=3064265 RepID=UPI003013E4CB|nr:lactate utilization protein [Planctomycetaceae bacterium SH412]
MTISARDSILGSIRRHLPEAAERPGHDGPWIQYPDPLSQFASVLEAIGGRCVRVKDVAEINQDLATFPVYAAARMMVSLVPGAGRSVREMANVADPHELADVDLAILPGDFAVAENAAVWVTDAAVKHRVIYFLSQHLALVVSAGQVVHNLHEAYARLTFDAARFGAFIAGPSKTADIEQSLVIGAHGPRSMTVYLME